MKVKTLTISILVCAVCLLLIPAARADNITAYGWVTTDAITGFGGSGATLASLALPTCHNGTAACTTSNFDFKFTTGASLFFNANGADVQTWLASDVFGIHNLTNTQPLSTSMNNTIWLFQGFGVVTGTVAHPETFIIDHDDGVTLIINGQIVISSPGPSFDLAHSLNSGDYTGGVDANAPFSLVYAECCGGPARLITQLPVPEPAAVLLLGTVLFALSGAIRRRKAS